MRQVSCYTEEEASRAPAVFDEGAFFVNMFHLNFSFLFSHCLFYFLLHHQFLTLSLFLSVSQYSDENMMQPYNLAVCFGPSLVRGAHDDDVVTLQSQINALVKNIIVQHESIFPGQAELPGPVYEKCMTLEPDDSDPVMEDGDGESELEAGTTVTLSTSSSAGMPSRKGERPRAGDKASSHTSSSGPGPAGGSVAPNTKFILQLPMGPQIRPARSLSPGFVRKEGHNMSSTEDIQVQVDKEVCRQMNSVFKELLTRQTLQDVSSATSSPSQLPPRKGGAGRKGKGMFRSTDQLD